MNALTKLWNGLRWLATLVLPMFARARDVRGMSPAVRWTIHLVILLLIVGALYVLNGVVGMQGIVQSQAPEFVQNWFLPLMFLSLYALCWLVWWLYQLLVAPPPPSDFPDIDEAWERATAALEGAGLDVREAPLFLILGRPFGLESSLLDAAQLQLKINGAPEKIDTGDGRSPLHVYANREAIFVTCPGASQLGLQIALLAGEEGIGDLAGPGAVENLYDLEKTMAPGVIDEGTLRADPGLFRVANILKRAREQGRAPTPQERQEIDAIQAEGAGRAPRPAAVALRRNIDQADRCTARLRHVCRRIVEDRRPYCPVNGILLMVPFGATGADEIASEVGACCREDVAAAAEEFKVVCPIFALACELDTLPGYAEFIQRLPKAQLGKRMGQRFPLAADLDAEQMPAVVDSSVKWIGHAFFPNLVHSLWKLEPPGGNAWEVARGNSQLFRFLSQIRDRQRRIARIILRAVQPERGDPLMFGGCYLAGAAGEGGREPAFVRGVLRRLIDEQDKVSWAPAALSEDEASSRWAKVGYCVIGAAVAAFLIVAAFLALSSG